MSQKQFFKDNGYLPISNLIKDSDSLRYPVPLNRGSFTYHGSIDQFQFDPKEHQVEGSLSRYNFPAYKDLHFLIKKEVENILEMKLYPTYYYDRFYFANQELKVHRDRPACEISVTLQMSTNKEEPWDIWFKNYNNEDVSVTMNNGDGCIYRGNDLFHWRKPLKSKYNKFQNYYRKLKKLDDDTYHHQAFFHYVNADGPCLEYAFDNGNN